MGCDDRATRSFAGSGATLPVEQQRLLDEACDVFEDKWRGKGRPDILTALLELPEPLRPVALRELVQLDVYYRRKTGEAPAAAEYAAKFPDLEPTWLAGVVSGAADPRARTADGASGPAADGPDAIPGYEILGELGRGGMGVVHRARQVALKREVALKTVLRAGTSKVAIARFWAEAEVMAAVDHPHVVRVIELGEHAGRPFMAMELVTGGSLADRLNHSGSFPPAEAARLIEKVARGVAAAHELGIVHRDLKPGNVLLDAAGEPKVTDFGLAKRASHDLTATQAVMGTPAYMAPEQAAARSRFVGPPADVWALGVILYECVAGKRPFEGESAQVLLSQIQSAEPAALRTAAGAVPRDVATIVSKCLAKEPEHRYPTAAELADELARFLQGKPILARPVGRAVQAWRWCRRNRAVASLLAAVVVVFAAGAGIAGYFAVEEAKRAKESDDNARLAGDREKEATDERNKVVAEQARVLAEQKRIRRLLHVSRVNTAQSALNEGHVRRAIELLEEMRPGPGEEDLRGWEWHNLWRLTHREAWTHEIAPAPDRIGDGTNMWMKPDEVEVLVSRSGSRALTLTHRRETLNDKQQQGQSGGMVLPVLPRVVESSVAVVDTGTRAVAWRAGGDRFGGPILTLGLSPEGQYLAVHVRTEMGERLRLFNTRENQELLLPEPELPYVSELLVGPNGDWVAATPRFAFPTPWEGGKVPPTVAQAAAAAEAARPLVIVWDRTRGEVRRTPRTRPPGPKGEKLVPAKQATLLPDGHTAVVTYTRFPDDQEDTVSPEVWDISASPAKFRFSLPVKSREDLGEVSEDGRRMLVTAGEEWLVIDLATGTVDGRFSHPTRDRHGQPLARKALSNDGRTLVLSPTGAFEFTLARRVAGRPNEWAVTNVYLAGRLSTLAGDGRWLYGTSGGSGHSVTLHAWDLYRASDYPGLWELPDDPPPKERTPGKEGFEFPTSGRPSSDGRVIVVRRISAPQVKGELAAEFTLLDTDTGLARARFQRRYRITEPPVLSPDFRRTLTLGPGGQWSPPRGPWDFAWWSLAEAETDREVTRGDGAFAGEPGFSEDGRYLLVPHATKPDEAAIARQEVRDATTGALLTTVPAGQVVFDPRGGFVVVGLLGPKVDPLTRSAPAGVAAYELPGGRELWSLRNPSGGDSNLRPMAVSPDGRRVVVLSGKPGKQSSSVQGASVRLLDARTGAERAALPVGSPFLSLPPLGPKPVLFSHDSRRLVVLEGRDAVVWALDGESPVSVRLRGHEERIAWCGFEPGGRLFTLEEEAEGGGWSGAQGLIKVWDVDAGRLLLSLPVPEGVVNRQGNGFPASELLAARARVIDRKLVLVLADRTRVYDGTPVKE